MRGDLWALKITSDDAITDFAIGTHLDGSTLSWSLEGQ